MYWGDSTSGQTSAVESASAKGHSSDVDDSRTYIIMVVGNNDDIMYSLGAGASV